jgi:hypothetical protein
MRICPAPSAGVSGNRSSLTSMNGSKLEIDGQHEVDPDVAVAARVRHGRCHDAELVVDRAGHGHSAVRVETKLHGVEEVIGPVAVRVGIVRVEQQHPLERVRQQIPVGVAERIARIRDQPLLVRTDGEERGEGAGAGENSRKAGPWCHR